MAISGTVLPRRDKVTFWLDMTGKGLEIGPSYSPFVRKSDGYNVKTLDHMSAEDLRKKYSDKDPKVIEDVDFVWHGEPFKELIEDAGSYDWIVASHVVEHTPDLIQFLQNCADVLKPDGVLSLVVPDKRFCFDHFRALTGIAEVIDSHVRGRTQPSPGTVAESLLYNVFNNGKHGWALGDPQNFKLRFTAEQAAGAMGNADKRYMDCHCWNFTPSSFRMIVQDLNDLGLMHFKEVGFIPTDPTGGEFYISLSKTGAGCPKSRAALLMDIERENLAAAVSLS